jgi:hypothetical protein
MRSFLGEELAELLPGGAGKLSYASTFSIRLPVDVAITEQSETAEIYRLLRAELDGVEVTGLDPVMEGEVITVDFNTCIVHAVCPALEPST